MATIAMLVAAREGEKTRTKETLEGAYHKLQKQEPMKGMVRVYTPYDDEGEKFPSESTRLQVKAQDVVAGVREQLTKLFDLTATIEYANCEARADIVVGETPILQNVPISVLLFFEKQLVDLRTFLSKLPTLDPAEEWHYDKNQACFATDPIETVKTKKTHKVITKAPATEKHQADTELIYEDLGVGRWKTTKFSGCFEAEQVQELVKRVDELQKAVKMAREAANGTTAQKKEVGKAFFDYIFAQ